MKDCNPEHQHCEVTTLAELQAEKGRLSRLIGAAKKQGDDISALLDQMKSVSSSIKAFEEQAKTLRQPSTQPNSSSGKATTIEPSLPRRFSFVAPNLAQHKNIEIVAVPKSFAERWDSYVNSHPGACLYHLWAFATIIEKSFGHQTHYLAAICRDTNTLCGVLPAVDTNSTLFGHYITSMPFFNYGGPLADSKDIEQQLLSALISIAQQSDVSHIELREIASRPGYPAKSEKVSMILALPESESALSEQIGSKVRAQVKKGQMNAFQFKTGKQDLLDDFYQVFSRNMRDLGTPVYSKAFFANVLESLPSQATIAILFHQSEPVSCAFLIGYQDTLEIPWASTVRKANPLNANMVLYWHVLCFAIEQAYRYFDFGRSSKDAPTYRFKKQWGALPVELPWHYWLKDGENLPQLNPNNPKYRLLISIWRRLPLFLANMIGPWVVRSLP